MLGTTFRDFRQRIQVPFEHQDSVFWMKENVLTTTFEPNEHPIFIQSSKICDNENKAIHSILSIGIKIVHHRKIICRNTKYQQNSNWAAMLNM